MAKLRKISSSCTSLDLETTERSSQTKQLELIDSNNKNGNKETDRYIDDLTKTVSTLGVSVEQKCQHLLHLLPIALF